MTEDVLARLRRRHEQATPGPWTVAGVTEDPPEDAGVYVHAGTGIAEHALAAALPYNRRWEEDAELIAEARNALPALLDVAEVAERFWRTGCQGSECGWCEDCSAGYEDLGAALARLRATTEEGTNG